MILFMSKWPLRRLQCGRKVVGVVLNVPPFLRRLIFVSVQNGSWNQYPCFPGYAVDFQSSISRLVGLWQRAWGKCNAKNYSRYGSEARHPGAESGHGCVHRAGKRVVVWHSL